jgi:hypothetical protein
VATIGSKSLESKKVATIGSKSLEIGEIFRGAVLGENIVAGRWIARFFDKQPETHKTRFSSDFRRLVATFYEKSDFEPIVASGSRRPRGCGGQ